jgi:glycosyltransferase involved in cell wall biosynthesis
MNYNLTIIIPCYNESLNIPKVIPMVLDFSIKNNIDLIVVNDGSKDDSLNQLMKFKSDKYTVISHKVNLGYGAAIKTGIRECATDFCITIDADGQHDLNDVLCLSEFQRLNDADLVIGNRNFGGSTKFRNFGKRLIYGFTTAFIKLNIKDLNSGMKLYRTHVVKSLIRWTPDSMAYSDIVTLMHVVLKYKIVEIDISINNRIEGKSTINYRTAIDTVKEISFIIVNIFPLRFFTIVSLILISGSMIWSMPFVLSGRGMTVGGSLLFLCGLIVFLQGIVLEIFCRSKFENYERIRN